MLRTALTGAVIATLALAGELQMDADEGMWLFNAPPRQLLKERYNFDPTPQWLEHVQKASIRFRPFAEHARLTRLAATRKKASPT